MSKLYIIRYPGLIFPLGSVVAQIASSFQQRVVTVRPHNAPLPCAQLRLDCLLELGHYLTKQPTRSYGVLVRKVMPLWAEEYLHDAATETYGSTPFRFESPGEVVYYIKQHQLNANQFRWAWFEDVPTL